MLDVNDIPDRLARLGPIVLSYSSRHMSSRSFGIQHIRFHLSLSFYMRARSSDIESTDHVPSVSSLRSSIVLSGSHKGCRLLYIGYALCSLSRRSEVCFGRNRFGLVESNETEIVPAPLQGDAGLLKWTADARLLCSPACQG